MLESQPSSLNTNIQPFEFANTKTKLIWSLSQVSFANRTPGELAKRLADYGIDAARATYSVEAAATLKKFRYALVAEMEKRNPLGTAEGWCPLVISHLGRRAILVVPGDRREIAAEDLMEIEIRVDIESCLGSNSKPEAKMLEVCVTSPDMLARLKEGSRLSVSYMQTEFVIESIQKLNEQALVVMARATDAATLLTGMDIHSADISKSLFPLIPEDSEAFERRFDDLADYVIVSGLRSLEELDIIRRFLVGNSAKPSKRHPTVTIQDSLKDRSAAIPPRILLKVDSQETVDLLPTLLTQIDGIVLSRSELGITLSVSELPIVQKQLIAECNRLAKIVIVASELMYSMRVNPNPTRAEVSDMSNAAADGADAVFLAEEVTEGPHADLVAQFSKETLFKSEHLSQANWHRVPFEISNDDDAIAYGALQVAEHAGVKAIVCITEGGYTANRLSSLRTPVDIIAITYNHSMMRQLNLLRSVRVLTLGDAPAFDKVLEETKKVLVRQCGFSRGDRFVFVSLTASPIGARNSNIFTLQEID